MNPMPQVEGDRACAEEARPQDAYNLPLPFGLHRVTQALNAMGTLLIIGLMLLINSDIIGRTGFDAPLRGVTELVSLSIVGIRLEVWFAKWIFRRVRPFVRLSMVPPTTKSSSM